VRGYGRVTREVVRAMLSLAPASTRLAMLVDPATWSRDDFPDGLELIEVAVDVPPGEAASAAGSRSLKDMLRFRRAAARDAADILYFPTVYSYFPAKRGPRVAVAFMDTIAETLPKQVFPRWHNKLFWTLKCRAAVRRADLVLTISEASKRAVEAHYPVGNKPFAVIPCGFDRAIFHPRRSADEESRERANLKIGPRTQVILAVGGLSPHKNLARLVHALARLVAEKPDRDAHLVLVGATSGEDVFFSSKNALEDLIREKRLEGRVTFTGFVSDERLGALYRTATVLAFPSLLEGFGLPALEAMASETAVAASTRGALPEVLGDAGFFFDAESTEDAARVLARCLDDPAARARATATGLRIAEGYSWEAAAKKLLAEFEKLAGGARTVREPGSPTSA
jgi:glycosyltransferase involved in cell wall biosynthesis